eukprot:jgi/Ulvmu1/6152/UM028_0008.1
MALSTASSTRSVTALGLGLPSRAQRASVVVRAESEDVPKQKDTVFYGGNSYTGAEWEDAKKSGTFKPAPESTGEGNVDAPMTIGSIMAFDGPAPEVINSRLAMLGFVAALGAEVASGENLFQQIGEAPGPILITFVTIAIASFVPLIEGMKPEAKQMGPFNAEAELYNGRAAMLGLVALGITELALGGKALF